MKTVMIAITVTGVIIGGLIFRAINSVKDSHEDRERMPEPNRAQELSNDFLL